MKNNEQLEGARQAKETFSPHPLPLLAHPLPTSPQIFCSPRRARLLARFFACLFDLRQEKKRKRLLRRLPRKRMGGRKVGPTHD